MKKYKKYVFESRHYEECEKVTAKCAEENDVDYIIEAEDFPKSGLFFCGYLLMDN